MVTVANEQQAFATQAPKVATNSSGRSSGTGRAISGKPQTAAQKKVVANLPKVVAKSSGKPEVEISGKFDLPLIAIDPHENLPLTENDSDDIEWDDNDGEEITEVMKGWRWEQNSNGYYRWRWQMKDVTGNSITYLTQSGRTGYKRGSSYVNVNEAKERISRGDFSAA